MLCVVGFLIGVCLLETGPNSEAKADDLELTVYPSQASACSFS